MDIWWEYFPVLEIIFSSIKTLFLQNEPPRWMIPEYLLIYLFLVAKVWCTFICFPSATKPGTKSESFWIFQWCVLLFTEGPSILPWPYGFPKKSSDFSIQGSSFTPGLDCTTSPGHLRPQWLMAVMGGWRSRNISRACTKVTTPNSPIRSAKGSAGSSHKDPGISLLP